MLTTRSVVEQHESVFMSQDLMIYVLGSHDLGILHQGSRRDLGDSTLLALRTSSHAYLT